MNLWMILVVGSFLLLCVGLYNLLKKKSLNLSIEQEKRKFFPESLKPPKETGQQNSPEK